MTNDIAVFHQLGPHSELLALARSHQLATALGRRIIRQLIATSGPAVVHDPKAEMDSLRTRFILSIPFMVIGFMLTRAPFMMTSVAPSKPWADGPLKLVTTPQFETKKVQVDAPPVCILSGC
jgi:hypothetical protein